jgi:hypothetical protein
MTARCRICGRKWIISIRQDTTGYVCPDCEYRGRMGREGILKGGDLHESMLVQHGRKLVHRLLSHA